jgi:hypothetical protein
MYETIDRQRFQWVVVLVAGVGFFLDGYTVSLVSRWSRDPPSEIHATAKARASSSQATSPYP